jgi:hypothetical protein
VLEIADAAAKQHDLSYGDIHLGIPPLHYCGCPRDPKRRYKNEPEEPHDGQRPIPESR